MNVIVAILTILLAMGIMVVLYIIGIYNGLVVLRNRFKNAFAQIDVQLKRRYDLIPNLVETARAYLKHERETLEAVIQARNTAVAAAKAASSQPTSPQAMQGLIGADNALMGMMRQLMVTFEQYPDLKANQNMAQLSEELTSTENKVAFARQAYNDSVMSYNNQCEQFPSNLVAGSFKFEKAILWEVESKEERVAPKVKF